MIDIHFLVYLRRTRDEVVELQEEGALNDEMQGEVKQFCYMLDSEGRVARVVRERVASTWRKWQELFGLLMHKVEEQREVI